MTLRVVRDEDLDAHFEQQADPDSAAMAVVPARDRAAFDEHWAKLRGDPALLVLTIEVEGRVAGSALSFVRDGRRVVGYRIAQELWGRGVASAALEQLVTDHVRERPLHAEVATHNPASRRVLEKAGFEVVDENTQKGTRFWILRLGDGD